MYFMYTALCKTDKSANLNGCKNGSNPQSAKINVSKHYGFAKSYVYILFVFMVARQLQILKQISQKALLKYIK